MRILCIGLSVCDIMVKPVDSNIFNVDSANIEMLSISPGGDALNVAVNLSRLGIDTDIAGRVGDDAPGQTLMDYLESEGVGTQGIIIDTETATSTSIVFVEESGERHFAYYGGASDRIMYEDINSTLIERSELVHVGSTFGLKGLDGDGTTKLLSTAKSNGAYTSMDVTWDNAGKWFETIEKSLEYTDIFMPSINEAKMITGLKDPVKIAEFFRRYGVSIFGLKLGSDGCYVTDYKDDYHIEANKVEAVDTTGAGDSFVSGFLAGFANGMGIYKCAQLGNALAAECVMKLGATQGMKDIDFKSLLDSI